MFSLKNSNQWDYGTSKGPYNEAVHALQKHYGLFILSTAPWKNPTAWSDKVTWVTKYLDDVFHKRMVITHRMDICQGDYLIDDYGKTGQANFLANRLNLARKSSLTGKVYWSI